MVKNPPANAGDPGDMGSIPGLGRSSGGRHGSPLQYSCLGYHKWGLKRVRHDLETKHACT